MPNSVYKIIELVGTSPDSWEDAAKNAVNTAAKSLKDLRVAEVMKQDMVIEEGKPLLFMTKVSISLKNHTSE